MSNGARGHPREREFHRNARAAPEGVVTLYDRVTEAPLACTGTGHLIAGPLWAHEGPVVIPPGTMIIFR